MNTLKSLLCFSLLLTSLALMTKSEHLEGYQDRPIIVKEASDKSENLIILLHAIKTSPTFIKLYYPLSSYVDDYNFNLVIPAASKNKKGKRYWNSGEACCDFYNDGADDLLFLDKVIAHYREQFGSKKIYIVGHSNGGFMAHHYACYGREKIDGFFSYAGNPSPSLAECRSFDGLNVILAHGKKDRTIPYEGGEMSVGGHDSIPVKQYVSNYRETLSCSELSTEGEKNYAQTRFGKDAVVFSSAECARDNKLTFWDFNAGHIPKFNRRYIKDMLKTLLR